MRCVAASPPHTVLMQIAFLIECFCFLCFLPTFPFDFGSGGARMDLFAAYERMGQKLENQPPG